MVDDLDVVAVRVEYEGAVITRVVDGALAALTPDGTAALKAMAKSHRELAATLLGGMHAPQLRGFIDALEHVIQRLHEAASP